MATNDKAVAAANAAAAAAAEEANDTAAEQAATESALVTAPDATFYAPSVDSVVGRFLQQSADFISSMIDDGSRASQARIYNAINNNDGAIADLADDHQIIDVVDFMIFPVDVENDKGEILRNVPRTVLITQDGKSYGSVADGVFRSMSSIYRLVSNGPWTDEPLKIAAKRVKTRKGFLTLQLILVP